MNLALAFPWALLLLPLPLLVWRVVPPHRHRVTALRVPFFRRITEAAGIDATPGAVVLRRRRIQMVVAILIWLLLVFGLARPEQLGEPVTLEKAGRDVVLSLDISGSMDERDFKAPDGSPVQRLEAVKSVLSEFIAGREGDRMALIIFGTRAFVQAPFTEDLASLQGFLDQTVVGMAGPNTALGDAIGLGLRTFDASEVEDKLMILLSDGADTSSRMTPVNAAAIAADRGVTIYTIGVGDPEASGEDKVDLEALKDIADRTGGQFFYADDQSALTEIYAEIDAQAPRVVETLSYRPRESLSHLAFAAALALAIAGLTGLLLASRRSV
ncbi:VWA domain-containing protein [Primorskyibacter sp. S87]|uniref:VWA domain-containing protein n=1 Tax=Primorskyibacter sp. S87 TaxID=3415126 RepID=UPI003C7DB835